jgi:hypothetical protein
MTDASDDSEKGGLPASGDSDDEAEVVALNQVIAAFRRLNRESRERVLRTVSTYFGMTSLAASPPAHSSGIHIQSSAVSSGVSFSEDRTPSPKEFILDKKPLQDIERIACLAYYLTHYRDTATFKTLDLSKLNTEAAQIKLGNAAKAVDNAQRAGYLLGGPNGTKQISAIGELYVQALPDRAAAKEAAAQFRQRRKSRRSRAGENTTQKQETPSESTARDA